MKTTAKNIDFAKWGTPLLNALKDKGGSGKAKDIVNRIAEAEGVSDDVLNEVYANSKSRKFPNQIAWCKQYLVWEGILTSPRHGVWSFVKGKENTTLTREEFQGIILKWSKYFMDLKKEKTEAAEGNQFDEAEISPPSEETVTLDGNVELITFLRNMTPQAFEKFCGDFLNHCDFYDVKLTKASGDGGIDGTAILELNPFIQLKVFIQCKKYEGTVPIDKVREFIGVMESDHVKVDRGIIITTGSFTKAGYELEKSVQKLELIDGERLVDLIKEKNFGVKERTLYEVDVQFFSKYEMQ